MAIDEIIEEMRRNDRLLKESEVVLAVQKELIKMGYEPFEERVMGIYDAIDNVPKVCIMEQYDALYEKANKGGWIPCSEELPPQPKENPIFENKPLELYLVSEKYADYPLRAFWNGKFFTDGWGKLDVLAWMPLPEKYKGE